MLKKMVSAAVCAAVICCCAAVFSACTEKISRCLYTIAAEYDPESRTLSAGMTVTVPNNEETAFGELKFQLWANAFREGAKYAPISALYAPAVYYAGVSYGEIVVESVLVGETAATFSVGGEDENILTVALEEPLYPDESVTLTMRFTVTLAETNHRLGVGENNVSLTHFYPILCSYENGFREYVYAENGDPFVNECADYDVTLTLPSAYHVACGAVCGQSFSGGKTSWHMTAENARDIAFVFGKTLESGTVETETQNGTVTVEYFYNAESGKASVLQAAAESLNYFSETFGAYVRDYYAVVQTDFPYGGMEYDGLVMISSSLSESDLLLATVHETAHQWWYAAVGSNQFEEAWQDEGLAEYSSALFWEAHPGYGVTYDGFVHTCETGYRAFFSIQSQLSKETNTVMTRPLTAFSGAYEYRNIAYDKGVIMFDRVRAVTGDQKFFAALRSYYEEFTGRIASPDQMIACFEKERAKVEGLFRSFLDGSCMI